MALGSAFRCHAPAIFVGDSVVAQQRDAFGITEAEVAARGVVEQRLKRILLADDLSNGARQLAD